jgi:adenylate cyclase
LSAGTPSQTPAAGDMHGRFATWLTQDGMRITSIALLVDGFCAFLNREGFDIRRCNLATDTVHPQMWAMRHVWFSQAGQPTPINPAVLVSRQTYRVGEAMIDEVFFNAEATKSPQYIASPFYRIERDGELYELIRPPGEAQAFPVFDDLARDGCTAYLGLRLASFGRVLQLIGLATGRADGLTGEQVEELRTCAALLMLHVNTLIEAGIKSTLARVYIGQDPGERVCAGMISLGSVISMEGALWFSDLRDFTAASERLDPERLLEMLNDYFAVVTPVIYAAGGEVLKFMGDAVLAVFPTTGFADPGEACRAALGVVRQVTAALEPLNARRAAEGLEPIRHGVGLHYGQGRYGNIGTRERLDFTLIGRAVNVASRIEGMTKLLGHPVLCSDAFAALTGDGMTALGEFELKGVEGLTKIGIPPLAEA